MDKKSPVKSNSVTRRRRVALIAAIAVLVVVSGVIARFASSRMKSAPPVSPKEALAETAAPAATAPAVRRARVTNVAVKTSTPAPVAPAARVRDDSNPAPAAARESAAKPAVAAKPSAPSIAPTANAVSQPPVTMTGCLESTVDEAQFRLTDVEGADAPKSRSWKSGFLKKSPAPVSLVDLSDPKGMRKLVGHRVVATGVLNSGELRVRSLKPSGASCN